MYVYLHMRQQDGGTMTNRTGMHVINPTLTILVDKLTYKMNSSPIIPCKQTKVPFVWAPTSNRRFSAAIHHRSWILVMSSESVCMTNPEMDISPTQSPQLPTESNFILCSTNKSVWFYLELFCRNIFLDILKKSCMCWISALLL